MSCLPHLGEMLPRYEDPSSSHSRSLPKILPSLFRGAALSDLPAPEALARIDVPATILAWVDDPGHPLSTAEFLAALLPKATLAVASTPEDVETWPGILSEDVGGRA